MTTSNASTAPERDYAYVMTGPEIELVEVVRLAHMQSVKLTFEHRDGAFVIRLADTAAGRFIEGRGATFEEAWRSMPSADLDGLTLGERIAARGVKAGGHLALVEAPR